MSETPEMLIVNFVILPVAQIWTSTLQRTIMTAGSIVGFPKVSVNYEARKYVLHHVFSSDHVPKCLYLVLE